MQKTQLHSTLSNVTDEQGVGDGYDNPLGGKHFFDPSDAPPC
ncbi:hypothetical protein JCM19241_511 [Vibrio ishigakensis]|uniref:Uncharacterized protein n=1 Tax=Vibrio ishigakensis TaxID=1481914 RepID=A0A0B8QMF3_9VIBR|nr:hypothetical protein JCM19241_511 [Vibrio ishigakensis]